MSLNELLTLALVIASFALVGVAILGWIVTFAISIWTQRRDFEQRTKAQEESFRQQLEAQRDQFRLTVRNAARLRITATIRNYQNHLGDLAVKLIMHDSEGAYAETLKEGSSDWILSLEEHENLYPETADSRIILVRAGRGLMDSIRATCKWAQARGSSGGVITDPKAFPKLDELWEWVQDLIALMEDLRIHLQNECLRPITKHESPTRQPTDPLCPRLVMNNTTEQLEISPPPRSPLSA